MAPPTKKLLGSCYNPQCQFYSIVSEKAPLKCSRCRSARYCNKDCQKAHWRQHKEFCIVWTETSAEQGDVPVEKIKEKMMHFIWILRGLAAYNEYLFKEYRYHKGQGRKGFMEIVFESFEELFEAIKFIEKQPVVGERTFSGMPGTPSFVLGPDGRGVPQRVKMREPRPGQEQEFVRIVDDKMHFSTNEDRPNLQWGVEFAQTKQKLLLISVSVQLHGTYSTNMYDFLYENLSYTPER